jgi:Arc/MetJ family transcription regulator
MKTSIDIDEDLLVEAMKATGAKTKKEAVRFALAEVNRAARARRAFRKLRGMGWKGDLEKMRRGRLR